jgi:hypothetical protein
MQIFAAGLLSGMFLMCVVYLMASLLIGRRLRKKAEVLLRNKTGWPIDHYLPPKSKVEPLSRRNRSAMRLIVVAFLAMAPKARAGVELNNPKSIGWELYGLAKKVMDGWGETPSSLDRTIAQYERARAEEEGDRLSEAGKRCFHIRVLMARAALAKMVFEMRGVRTNFDAAQEALNIGNQLLRDHCDDRNGPGPGEEGKRGYSAASKRMHVWAMQRARESTQRIGNMYQVVAGTGEPAEAVIAVSLAAVLALPLTAIEVPALPALLRVLDAY